MIHEVSGAQRVRATLLSCLPSARVSSSAILSSLEMQRYFYISCLSRSSLIMFSISMFSWITDFTVPFRHYTQRSSWFYIYQNCSASFSCCSHSSSSFMFYSYSPFTLSRRLSNYIMKLFIILFRVVRDCDSVGKGLSTRETWEGASSQRSLLSNYSWVQLNLREGAMRRLVYPLKVPLKHGSAQSSSSFIFLKGNCLVDFILYLSGCCYVFSCCLLEEVSISIYLWRIQVGRSLLHSSLRCSTSMLVCFLCYENSYWMGMDYLMTKERSVANQSWELRVPMLSLVLKMWELSRKGRLTGEVLSR